MKTITVYGSSQVDQNHPVYMDAQCIGRSLARAGFAVMSGGYLGVMEAVSKGASEAAGARALASSPTRSASHSTRGRTATLMKLSITPICATA